MEELEDKVIIVTGSTDGLGRTLALYFMRHGARVVFHGRSMEKLRNLTDDFDDLDDWMIVCGDVSNESDCKHIIDLTIKKFGKLDVLINNSVTVLRDGMSQHSLPEFDELLSLNLHSIGFLSELCAPHLIKSRGKILNVNTLSAFFQFIQHPFADIAKLAYENFNGHCAKLYKEISVHLLDPCPCFVQIDYLTSLCFTYSQQLNQWAKANARLEDNGQLEKLALDAALLVLKK